MKEIHRFKEKYYQVEYFSGEFHCDTLEEAVRKVLHLRKNPHWAFGDGSAKIYVMDKEVITRKGKCVKVVPGDAKGGLDEHE
jgi:mannose-6-phosphate isomerase-like protein (cupin superfamily)